MIYCSTLGSWLKETIWCFVVIKIWKNAVDLQPFPHTEGKPDLCPWCSNPMWTRPETEGFANIEKGMKASSL
jgi:hypothetical protein